jgi:ABC-type nitrate/sulfonate/bicarbonate transport system ATPase subunit
VTLIGHSGCGKSTLLNLVAGSSSPRRAHAPRQQGDRRARPERGVVFQNHSLLPWLTCAGNVTLAVERVFGGKETKAQLQERTQEALALVGLAPRRQVSRGDLRRHEAARRHRAGAGHGAKVLLLDEPFGALDALTRAHLQDELMGIVAQTGSTVVMVTHDVDEAVLLSDRIVMMTNGPRPPSADRSRWAAEARASARAGDQRALHRVPARGAGVPYQRQAEGGVMGAGTAPPARAGRSAPRRRRQRHGRRARVEELSSSRPTSTTSPSSAPSRTQLQPHPALPVLAGEQTLRTSSSTISTGTATTAFACTWAKVVGSTASRAR